MKGVSSVIVVGGGASAVYVTAALRERAVAASAPAPLVTVVGREAEVGRGLAYGRADAHHRLNSPAGSMSLSADDAGGFLRWLAETGWRDVDGSEASAWTFVPRRVFGNYVASAFQALLDEPDSGVTFQQGDVTDIATAADGVTVTLASGQRLRADRVVLALGNPAPGPVPSSAARVIDDPWAEGALDAIGDGDRVLLIGTGLTTIDIATSLARRAPGVRLTATSRNLLLPAVHLAAPAAPGPALDGNLTTLSGLLGAVHDRLRAAHAAGAPWQPVLDGIRPQTMALWQGLSVADRRRFVAHVARRWDVHRHRMARTVATELQGLIDGGTLTLQAKVDSADFDVSINCTGPRSVARRGWNAVVDALVDAGDATSDPTGLGFDADASGALRDSTGAVSDRVFAVGAGLKGALWETVAIGEIRLMSTRVAERILAVAPDAA